MPKGYLRVHIIHAHTKQPIPQAMLRIYRIENQEIVFEDFRISDACGQSMSIPLPSISTTCSYIKSPPYTTYHLEVRCDGYETLDISGIQIFAQEHAYLQISLQPTQKHPVPYTTQKVAAHFLWQKQKIVNKESIWLNTNHKIPQYVYLLKQDTTYKIEYTMYIKTIVSSLVYPTWDTKVILAIIRYMITYVLQCRNKPQASLYSWQPYQPIFKCVNEMVDSVFNEYWVNENGQNIESIKEKRPFQTNALCWQMQKEALLNKDVLSLLLPQESHMQLVVSNDCEVITHSYPGITMTNGMQGSDVEVIQACLACIANYYPSIQTSTLNQHTYTKACKKAIKKCQHIFFLHTNGNVDKSTWYKLLYEANKISQNTHNTIINQEDYTITQVKKALNDVASMYPIIPLLAIDEKQDTQYDEVLQIFHTYLLQKKDTFNRNEDIEVLMKHAKAIQEGNLLPLLFPKYPQDKTKKEIQKQVEPLLQMIQQQYPNSFPSSLHLSSFAQFLGLPPQLAYEERTWNLLHVMYLQLTMQRR